MQTRCWMRKSCKHFTAIVWGWACITEGAHTLYG